MKDKSNIKTKERNSDSNSSGSESDEEWGLDFIASENSIDYEDHEEDLGEYFEDSEEEEYREYLEYQERKRKRRKTEKGDKDKKEPYKEEKKKRITAKDFILNKTFESEFKLQTLEDLINILDHKDAEKQQKELVSALHELNNLVGMKHLKQQIMNQILFFVQDLHEPGTFLHTVITGDPGVGKCLGYNTPIIMFDGSIKMVQDVKKGDSLMGDDSTFRTVLSTCKNKEQMYKISQVKGDDYVVNESHILSIRVSSIRSGKEYRIINNNKYKKGETVDISVKDYLKLSNKHHLKGYKVPIEFKEKEVPFDPYIIGLWLGDGTSSCSEITNQDSTVLKYLVNNLSKYNCYLQHIDKYVYSINGHNVKTGLDGKKGSFLSVLQDLKLINNKHIPDIYKYNSKKNQLKLLAGLLDSDGHYSDISCSYDFIQKNLKLAKDVEYIVKCLGLSSTVKECQKSCMYKDEKITGTYHRQCISGNGIEKIPCLIPRKQASKRKQKKNNLNTGITVEKVTQEYYDQGPEYEYYYGFEIDGNHRFLLGDTTVTHNTCLTHIMSKIYRSLGFLDNDKIVVADRSNLIGMYLGHTAVQTKTVLESAKGGIILIDEAYSLGSEEGRDSFSKECIDTINQYLSEHCDELVCIIAGYKNEIENCFFKQNSGLDRRFPWRFEIDKYSSDELTEILYRQLNTWTMVTERSYINEKIKENLEYFKGNGGDTKNLLDKCKIAHARRAFVELASNEHNVEKSITEGAVESLVSIKNPKSITLITTNYESSNQGSSKRKRSRKNSPVKKVKIAVNKELNKEDFDKGLLNYLKIKKDNTDTKEHCKYEKLFLVEYLQDSWLKKTELRIENNRFYEGYDKFMSKNRDKRMLGKVDFNKKICEIDGIKSDPKKLYKLIDPPKVFECLKLQGLVTNEMKNSGKEPLPYYI
jgi:hypothetical protein